MNDLNHNAEEAQKKRLTYLKAIYFVALGMSLVYLLKFNYGYKVSEYNTVLFTIWALVAVLPPLFLYGIKSYVYAAVSASALASALLIFFLYVSGGADAPGIFWLAAVPLVCGILLNIRGAIAGHVVVAIALAYFWYLKKNGLGPNIIAQYGDYRFEKTFNLVTFLIFSSFTTHHYIRGEQKYAKRLIEQNSDVENLLRVLLHDIANTLSSMTYNLIKAREEEHAPATTELEKIEKAVEDINNLLNQVRHLKSVKDGKAEMPLKPVSLAIVLHDVFEKTETIATQKGIKLALDLSRERLMVHGEKTILSNVVLLNLLNNAVKFSHPGGRIDLRAYSNENAAIVEIQDYGIGMPENLVQQIFSLNTRTTRTGTQGEKGTGYGMPLVKEYLQMMGGSIDVVSREQSHQEMPQGTKVTLRLPLVQQ